MNCPIVDSKEVVYLWHYGYYDGPLSGICEWKNNRYWFVCVDRDSEVRRFNLVELSDGEWEEVDKMHELFRQHVGHHADYLDGKRVAMKPKDGDWSQYYKKYSPVNDFTKSWKERSPVATYRK